MTSSLDWFAAPFEAYGGTSGDGARRLLGQPSLDPLTVLVRETIQNSWDARDSSSACPLTYQVHLRTLSAEERRVLREVVFAEGVGHGRLGLWKTLNRNPISVIEISDSGTTGLAGPIRADLTPPPGEPTDFVDFIFNIGAVRDTELGGGTYGFGKTIAYVVSRASTMLVTSCVDREGSRDSRFIASAIGSQFSIGRKRYTGRHWWGHQKGDRIEPITGTAARSLANSLDLAMDRTGTNLLVLDPDLRGRNLQQAMQFLVSSIVWHAWPKMTPPPGCDEPPMRISARLNGEDFPIPEPVDFAALRPFVASLQRVRATQSGGAVPTRQILPTKTCLIECLRPKQELGHLGLTFDTTTGYSAFRHGTGATDNGDSPLIDACPFEGHSHHTALLRQAELVVNYEEGPPAAIAGYRWGGVFRSLEDVDDHFALAEPPAHDAWDPEFVEDQYGRTFVRVALRNINNEVREFAQPTTAAPSSDGSISTARIGDLLAGLIPSIGGATTERRRRGTPQNGKPGSKQGHALTVEILETRLVESSGGSEVHVTLEFESDSRTTILLADAAVRNDTGREASAPTGARPPGLGPLISGDLTIHPDDENQYVIPSNSGTRWTLIVSVPEVAALDLGIAAHAERRDMDR